MQSVRRINRAQSCFGLRTVNLTKCSFDPIDSYAKTLSDIQRPYCAYYCLLFARMVFASARNLAAASSAVICPKLTCSI